MSHWNISRRTFLRGTGASLSLPLLDAMSPSSVFGGSPAAAPKRMALFFVPNGVIKDSWMPATEGSDYALPYSLEPLRELKEDVLVISGLSQNAADVQVGGGHARATAALFTGVCPDLDGIKLGISVDQIVANHLDGKTRLHSLQLSTTGTQLNGTCDTGFSCAYSSCISWRDKQSPLPNDHIPLSVYERLFGKKDVKPLKPEELSRQQTFRKSVLDLVRDDARRLQRRLGRNDQQKLDEYLYSVREVERRVQASALPADGKHSDIEIPEGRPKDFGEHVRLMGDLIVLAFQSDITRMATFMYGSAASNQTYPMLGVFQGHHELSHHGKQEDWVAQLRKVDRFNVSLFAYVIERMKSVREGDGTLLDNSLLYYGSGLGDGNAHKPLDIPVLIAGRAGNAFGLGRHIKFPRNTSVNKLFLNMFEAMDVPVKEFSDTTGPLPGLSV
ncbi:MAG: DUF1552 domain-containing protein [Planctomycetota bacterium]|nr:DUF1552 domain-containing protein [Planctomycetota bacterium]MDA1141620.1 DUF1552 domain-containing protein [Planctomycetota bacterium]